MMKTTILILLAALCLLPAVSPQPALAEKEAGNWGAIAYSYSTGRHGYSYDYATQSEAINSAVQRCNTRDCKAVVWFENGCGAFSKGDGAYAWGIGATRAIAEGKALAECRKRAGGCRILVWACTSR